MTLDLRGDITNRIISGLSEPVFQSVIAELNVLYSPNSFPPTRPPPRLLALF